MGADGTACDQDGPLSVHDRSFMEAPDVRAAYAGGVEAAGQDDGWRRCVHI